MKLLIIFLFILTVNFVLGNDKFLFCFYGTWATYRNGLGKFDVTDINVDLCTHLVYSFAGIDVRGNVVSLDPYLDYPTNWGRDNFRKFNALKKKKPGLKTILAVGGWNEGSEKYSLMASNPTYRKNFVTSGVKMLRTYGFDGMDLDWEYPNRRDTVFGQEDVSNYVLLLKELRVEFDKYGLMLNAAVSAVRDEAALSYDIPAMSQYLDIIGLMTYDMYGAWDPVTGHNSPLHKGEGDDDVSDENIYSVDMALEYWINGGCPAEKLVIGLPMYGRTFTLTNPEVNGVRAPSRGGGITGAYTNTEGFIGYNEFCLKLKTQKWDVRYDHLAEVPYAVQNKNWVSFDDGNSLAHKTVYGLEQGIAGVMVWSIETDDFRGLCHGETFPLLRAIKDALEGNWNKEDGFIVSQNNTSTTPKIETSSQTSTSLSDSSSEPSPSVCKEEGLSSDPDDCSVFYMCIKNIDGILLPNKFQCPDGLQFDKKMLVCNYPELVQCVN